MRFHFKTPSSPRLATILLISAFLGTGCDKPKEKETSAAATPDLTLSTAQYGFVPRVSADAEALVAVYRLGEMRDAFKASRWMELFAQLDFPRDDPSARQVEDSLATPEAERAFALLRVLFDEEAVLVAAPGATAQVRLLPGLISEMQKAGARAFMEHKKAREESPDGTTTKSLGPTEEEARRLTPLVEALEVPSVYLAVRPGKHRAELEAMVTELVDSLPPELPPGVTRGTVEADGKHTLRTLRFNAAEALDARISDPSQKDEHLLAAMKKKRAEIAWGWIDDCFILSAGPDTSHVKLAATPGESILAKPGVAGHAAPFAEKRPFLLSHASADFLSALQRPLEIAGSVEKALPLFFQDKIPAPERERIIQEARAFDAKYVPLATRKFTDFTALAWWEEGLRFESRGGAMIDAEARPLTMGGMATPSTFVFTNSRSIPGGVNRREWVEDFSRMAWGWLEAIGREGLPEQTAMARTAGLPVVKELWRAVALVDEALGEESALVIDANGRASADAGLPVPEEFQDNARLPRVAWALELKDRPKLKEAWNIVSGTVTNLAILFAPGKVDHSLLVPREKTIGDAEIYWLPLWPALRTDAAADLTPHAGFAGERLFLGSSPSLTGEMAASKPAGEAAFLVWSVKPPVMLDMISANADTVPAFKQKVEAESPESRRDFEILGGLLRSVRSLEGKVTKEGRDTRVSATIQIIDAK